MFKYLFITESPDQDEALQWDFEAEGIELKFVMDIR